MRRAVEVPSERASLATTHEHTRTGEGLCHCTHCWGPRLKRSWLKRSIAHHDRFVLVCVGAVFKLLFCTFMMMIEALITIIRLTISTITKIIIIIIIMIFSFCISFGIVVWSRWQRMTMKRCSLNLENFIARTSADLWGPDTTGRAVEHLRSQASAEWGETIRAVWQALGHDVKWLSGGLIVLEKRQTGLVVLYRGLSHPFSWDLW